MALFCELESENVRAAWHEIQNLRLNLRRCVLCCWRKMLYKSQQLVWHRNKTKRMRLKLMVLVVDLLRKAWLMMHLTLGLLIKTCCQLAPETFFVISVTCCNCGAIIHISYRLLLSISSILATSHSHFTRVETINGKKNSRDAASRIRSYTHNIVKLSCVFSLTRYVFDFIAFLARFNLSLKNVRLAFRSFSSLRLCDSYDFKLLHKFREKWKNRGKNYLKIRSNACNLHACCAWLCVFSGVLTIFYNLK